MRQRTSLDGPFDNASPVRERVQSWGALADEILSSSKDRKELLAFAAKAAYVHHCALMQACMIPETDPRDHELLTPAEVCAEFHVKPYTVAEAMRRKQLMPWKPHPQAKRGFKVPRGVARAWATKLALFLACVSWEVVGV